MYYPYFVTYMLIGFAVSLAVFYWAVKNGQFSDQQRARFLPLVGDPEEKPTEESRWRRFEIYGLGVLVCAGLAATAAVLVFSLMAPM
jgi:cbb3-type cytochrome oxidase maturation protein